MVRHDRCLRHSLNEADCTTSRITSWIAQIQQLDRLEDHAVIHTNVSLTAVDGRSHLVPFAMRDDDSRTLGPGPKTIGRCSSSAEEQIDQLDGSTSSRHCTSDIRPFEKRQRRRTRTNRYEVGRGIDENPQKRLKPSRSRRETRNRRTVLSAEVMNRFVSDVVARDQITVSACDCLHSSYTDRI
jgi:hypothetical protein